MHNYKIIVIGGGHAGVEACLAAARMGVETLLLTHDIKSIGRMSCNPAIGGIGKSHLVREIDAMGGVMGIAADHSGIQFRVLNASKGSAVRATRAQIDRTLYSEYIQNAVFNQENLTVIEAAVDNLLVKNHTIKGVIDSHGITYHASCVVLTAGTFLSGLICIGDSKIVGGRIGSPASQALADYLRSLGFVTNRLKTGTPPRLNGDTICFKNLAEQKADNPAPVMSFIGNVKEHPPTRSCFITHTNTTTHNIIRDNLHLSPMVRKTITGIGPRYCPSIEDKVTRFAHRSSHQIFIEPEGLNTTTFYPNGISTSLPESVQLDMLHSIAGFENVEMTQPGYAIEYDFFNPLDLKLSLETQYIPGLFFAGQINGTTGYEEAAAQGLLAGINAALKVQDKEPLILRRDEAYIGVLVDDLTSSGVSEPYRIFTSRAEYRLLLREDNADQRLTEKAHALGLINEKRWRCYHDKYEIIKKENNRLRSSKIRDIPDLKNNLIQHLQERDNGVGSINFEDCTVLSDLLKRPEISYADLQAVDQHCIQDRLMINQIEAEVKYSGYIRRQHLEIERLKKYESLFLPNDIDYQQVPGLSNEACQILNDIHPDTLGQASRISGVTPAALSVLLVYLKKHSFLEASI